MSSIQSALAAIDSFIWGPPLLILLVGAIAVMLIRKRNDGSGTTK